MSKRIFHTQSQLTKALAHPTRLEIIHLLRKRALTVNQIVQMLGVRQAYISQQLLVLKHANILRSLRTGKEIYYEVADPKIVAVCDYLLALVTEKSLPDPGDPQVIDPVCGMTLTPQSATYKATYNGVRHYFCGQGCLKEFYANH
jgi:YHS domain-containing protein/DNA-binding transcriptional ArsR family regulator